MYEWYPFFKVLQNYPEFSGNGNLKLFYIIQKNPDLGRFWTISVILEIIYFILKINWMNDTKWVVQGHPQIILKIGN